MSSSRLMSLFELEPCESRTLLAGVTVITHGQVGLIFEQDAPAWLDGMADAIQAQMNGDASRVRMAIDDAGGTLAAQTHLISGNVRDSNTGEIILELDWSKAADGLFFTTSTKKIAELAVAQLLRSDWLPDFGHALAELPIHLIGHSRGGSLVAEMARLLGKAGIWVDQLTTLDPHPRTLSTLSTSDAAMGVAESVVFADNYYQNHSATLIYGQSLGEQAVDTDIDSFVSGYATDHSNTHLWYHGTIDLSPAANDGEKQLTSSMRSSWYTAEELGGAATGFHYSRIAGGDRNSTRASTRSRADAPIAGLHENLGGSGQREAMNWSAATWPSLLAAEPLDEARRADVGSLLRIGWAASSSSAATISFTLDTDRNPFNDALAPIGRISIPGVVGDARIDSGELPTAGLAPGVYYLRAAIRSNGPGERVFVDHRPVTLVAADALKLAAQRPLAATAGPEGRITLTGINGAAKPAVFEETAPDVWTARAFTVETGAGPVFGDVVNWHDPADQRSYSAMVTAAGLLVVGKSNGGEWTTLNVSRLTGDTAELSGTITAFTSTDGVVSIAALRGSGELVLFSRGGPAGQAWTIHELSTGDLAAQGAITPRFAGRLISYVTPWNGQNIAGLDDQGNIHAVWWAPGMARWTVSNLSEITGAPPLAGGLTAYQTSWQGINLAGCTPEGSLSVTWWVPAFGAIWSTSNLTDLFAGPRLDPASITSYVTPWGGLNIAGNDASSGKSIIYWWAPEITDWQIAPITDVIQGAPVLTGPLTGIAAADGTISLFGRASGGDAVRYFWRADTEWNQQNLTSDAVR